MRRGPSPALDEERRPIGHVLHPPEIVRHAEAAHRAGVPVRQEPDLVKVERLAPRRLGVGRVARDRVRRHSRVLELRSPVTQELHFVRSGGRPGEEKEEEERRAVLDELGQGRRFPRREPDRGLGNAITWGEHSEPDRGDPVEEIAERVSRLGRRVEEEPAEPLGLVVLEGDRCVHPRVVPDAESDVPLVEVVVEVARDAKRLVRLLEVRRTKELDELQALRCGAPGAEAKRVAHGFATARAIVHVR